MDNEVQTQNSSLVAKGEEINERCLKSEYESKQTIINRFLDDIKCIIQKTKTPLEGNCFYYHQTLNPYQALYSKQLNLFWVGKKAHHRICEIGFNAGHSLFLMLLGNPPLAGHITVFDLCEHPYVKPAFVYLRNQFPAIEFELIEGDSTFTLTEWVRKNTHLMGQYDIVHVDGGHNEKCIASDLENAHKLISLGGVIIIDDTNMGAIEKYYQKFLQSGNYRELKILQTFGYPHKMLVRVK